jgi:transposase
VHRDFCQFAIADGARARSAGRIATSPEQLELFAQSLAPTDRGVMEATGNALAIARILEPHVAEVVLAHAKQVRAISHARVQTDRVDAKILADLLTAGLIPAVWIGDDRVRMLRRLVSRRRGLVKRRTQIKNEIAAALRRNLKGPNPPATRSARRAASGSPPRRCRSTNGSPSTAACASWTSSAAPNWRSSTGSSPSRGSSLAAARPRHRAPADATWPRSPSRASSPCSPGIC